MSASRSKGKKTRAKKASKKKGSRKSAARKSRSKKTRTPKTSSAIEELPEFDFPEEFMDEFDDLEDESWLDPEGKAFDDEPVSREEVFEELHEELLDMLEAIPAEALTEGWPKDEDSLYEKAFLRDMLSVMLQGGYDGNDYVMRAVLKDEFRDLMGADAYGQVEHMDRALAAGNKHHLQVAVDLNNFFRQQRFEQ